MKNAFKNEPVLAIATLLAVVLGVIGVTVDINTVVTVLTVALPLVGGLLARAHVTPSHKVEAIAAKAVEEAATATQAVAPTPSA